MNNKDREYLGHIAKAGAERLYKEFPEIADALFYDAAADRGSELIKILWNRVLNDRFRNIQGRLSYSIKRRSEFNTHVYNRFVIEKDVFIGFIAELMYNYRFALMERTEESLTDLPSDSSLQRFAKTMWTSKYMLPEVEYQPRAIVVFQNGVYNLESGEFDENALAPITYSNPIAAHYVENADTPKFNDFLMRNFPNDRDTKILILRSLAYLSTTATALQKFFWWYGPGGSGKSCLADLFCSLIGQSNTTTLTWDTLNNQFSQSKILHKLVVKIDEWSEASAKEVSARISSVKRLTSGGSVAIQRKFENETDETLTAKFLFIANRELPAEKEDPASIKRRMVPIMFRNRIKSEEVKAEYHLQILRTEADAIASQSVRELHKFIKDGNPIGKVFEVTTSRALQEGEECYEALGDCVTSVFEADIIEQVEGQFTPTALLVELVEAMRRATKKEVPGQVDRMFKREIYSRFGVICTRKNGLNGKKYRGYENIYINVKKLVDSIEDMLEVIEDDLGTFPEMALSLGLGQVTPLEMLMQVENNENA